MFKDNLKRLRHEAGLKQTELAEKINVSNFTISVWERGERFPEFDRLMRLCLFFGVTEESMLYGDGTEKAEYHVEVNALSKFFKESVVTDEALEYAYFHSEACMRKAFYTAASLLGEAMNMKTADVMQVLLGVSAGEIMTEEKETKKEVTDGGE